MSDYTKTTNFTAKDSLPSGNLLKVIKGSLFDTEFDALATAVASKLDEAGGTITGNLAFTGSVTISGDDAIIDGGTY